MSWTTFTFVPHVSAQFNPSDVRINFTTTNEVSDHPGELRLLVFFTLVDSVGRAVLEPKLRTVKVAMLDPKDGGPYQADVKKAEGPIFISIVLDGSGSMTRSADALRQSALALLQNGPQNARYSIYAYSDSVARLTDFTDDKFRLEGAVNAVKPVNLAGTCLIDGAFKAVADMAAAVGPTDRRAIVILTDAKARNEDTSKCSPKTVDDVLAIATNKKFRIPIYTIGLKNTQEDVNEAPLRTMALTTGGAISIGSNLQSLFKEINDALNSQLMAEVFVKPQAGERTGALQVELDNGSNLTATSFTFESPADFTFKTPTPTATNTPLPPVFFEVSPMRFDEASKEFLVTVRSIISPEQIKQFRFQLVDQNGVAAGAEILLGAPLTGEVRVPVKESLPKQRVSVIVTAVDNGGFPLFSVTAPGAWGPTETPTGTLGPTDEPVGAVVDSIQYVDPVTKTAIRVKLRLFTPAKINRLRVALIDANTNVLARDFPSEAVAPELVLNLDRTDAQGQPVPAGTYAVRVFSIAEDGRELFVNSLEFVHTRVETPTPTATLTATPVVSAAVPISVETDYARGKLIFKIETLNPQQIAAYRFEFINANTAGKVAEREAKSPPFDTAEVDFAGIPDGQYLVRMRAYGANGEPVTDFQGLQFTFLGPTPTATSTLLPTATEIPGDIVTRIRMALEDPNQRGLVIGGFAVLVGGLLFTMYLLLRRPKKASTGTGFLAEMTGAMNIAEMQKEQEKMQRQQGAKTAAAPPPPAQQPYQPSQYPQPAAPPYQPPAAPMGGMEMTNPMPQMLAPQAFLMVVGSRDPVNVNRSIPVSQLPFTLGRKQRNLNFDQDDNVSRAHGEIIYENGAFYIVDNNSTHGTFVDNVQVPPGQRRALPNGCELRLGTTTVMKFQFGGSDVDSTNPVMPSYRN
ncbi:MAG: FHA domain-containing protein [Anaerolineales bacterium]|nr:FHA domain-containing protein [Anaerolineales bacterium]